MSTDPPQQTMAPPGEDPARTAPSFAVEAPDVERNRLGVNLAWEGLLLVFIALATAAWFLLGGVVFESLDAAATQLAGVAPYLLLATALAMTMRLGAAHLGLGMYAIVAAGIYANCVELGMALPAALGTAIGSIMVLGALTALLVTVLRIPGWAAGLITGVMGFAVLSVPYESSIFAMGRSDAVELAVLEPLGAWGLVAVTVVLSLGGGALGLIPGLRQTLVNCRDAAAQQGKRGVSGVVMTWLGLLGASAIAGGAGIVSLVPNPGSWAITLAEGDRVLPIAIALGIVLLGGTGLRGGRGGVFGTLLAAIVYYMVAFVMLQANLQMESYFFLPVGALLVGMVVHWVMDLANRPRRLPGLVYADGVPMLASPPQPMRPEPQHTSLEALLDSRPPAQPVQQPPQLVDPAVAAQTPPTLEDPAAAAQPAPPDAGVAAPESPETDVPTAIPQQPDPEATAVVPTQQRQEPAEDATAVVPAQRREEPAAEETVAAQQEPSEADATTVIPTQQREEPDAAAGSPAQQGEPADGDDTAVVPIQQPDDDTAVIAAQQRDSASESEAPQPDTPAAEDDAAVIAQQPAPDVDDTTLIAAQQRGDDTAVIPEQADTTAAIPQPATTQPPANEDDTANIPVQQRGSDDEDTTSITVRHSEEDDSADTTALPKQRREQPAQDSADTTALPSQTPHSGSDSSVVSESAPQEDDGPDTVKVRPKKTEPEEPVEPADSTEQATPSEPPPTSSNSESYLYRPPT